MKGKVSIKVNGKLVSKGNIICGVTGNENFEFFVVNKNEAPKEVKELFNKFKQDFSKLFED